MKVGRIDVQVRGKEWTKVRYVLAFKDNGPQADRGMRCARPGVIRRVVGLVGETGRDGECGGGLRSQLAPSVFQQVVRPVQRNATQRNATANTGPYKAPTRSNAATKERRRRSPSAIVSGWLLYHWRLLQFVEDLSGLLLLSS